MNIKELENENILLKQKLEIAQIWMQKEVKSQLLSIARKKINTSISENKDDFYNENVEEIITNTVSDFFGEMMLLNTPQNVVENIISAEILFYNMRKSNHTDGLGVISSYHKSIDFLIESTITKPFRKFAKKQGQVDLRVNDSLEKTFHSIVNKGYILGLGKLYHSLQKIKSGEKQDDYLKCFSDFLDKNLFIKDILLNDMFYKNFKNLISTEILGKKRHIGKIDFEETMKARLLLIGDLKDTNCMIYKLIEMGKPDF